MKPIPAEHDAYIIQKILMYCDQIQEAITQFGEDKSIFLSNFSVDFAFNSQTDSSKRCCVEPDANDSWKRLL